MSLITNANSLILWQDLVRDAENSCAIHLNEKLETYLISLLTRYLNKPEMTKSVFATALLEALEDSNNNRYAQLRDVGDRCLLFAGLFPRIAEKRRVKLRYFVDVGQSAYYAIAATEDLFSTLALKFVPLMDVLQSIRQPPDMLPLEAYEQWQELGSQRAYQLLKSMTGHL
jgi:hypothetical protein